IPIKQPSATKPHTTTNHNPTDGDISISSSTDHTTPISSHNSTNDANPLHSHDPADDARPELDVSADHSHTAPVHNHKRRLGEGGAD
ncbi:MAG: hypothetical protein ACP5KV_08415, partial [Candidatus Methanomethylicaceae archaeon]